MSNILRKVKRKLKDLAISAKSFIFAEKYRLMMKSFLKWVVWVVSISAVAYLATAIIMFGNVLTNTVYDTPFGKIDIDTAKIGFMDYWGKTPCYEIHREVIKDSVGRLDTVRYYRYPHRVIYYRVTHIADDSLCIQFWYPNDNSVSEPITDYFRKEDIFIK